jgi:putative membrane protein
MSCSSRETSNEAASIEHSSFLVRYSLNEPVQFLMERSAEQDPRVYFAAERTLLAWIRTGLGLMGVGFAVSRFGLFLRQISAGESHLPARTTGLSLWSGVALVGLGILVNLSSVLHYLQTVRQLRSGTWIAGRVSTNAVILAIVLAAIGLGMAIYLVLVR